MDVLGCPVPDNCWVDLENDAWARVDATGGSLTLGVLASQAAFAGRYTSVKFRNVEGVVEKGRSVATFESPRSTNAFRLPFTGRVVARNDQLPVRPKLLNDSPYERGWVVRAVPSDPQEPYRVLVRAADARAILEARIQERKIRCYPATPDVEMYEIGSECSATLAKLDEELVRHPADDIVLLVTDDPTSPVELTRWADRTGHTLLDHRTEGSLHHFLLRKEAAPVPRLRGRATGEVSGA